MWSGMTDSVVQSFVFILAFRLTQDAVSGSLVCHDSDDCVSLPGHICHNSQCVCDPPIREMGLFSCAQARSYGDKCRSDHDCFTSDENLICGRTESRTCRCRRGLVWDIVSKRCYLLADTADELSYAKFDLVRDFIIPAIVIMTVGAMAYLGFKLFCSCRFSAMMWRRQRRCDEFNRDAEASQISAQPATTWVASYRVFSSVNGVETRTSPPFPPCLLLPVGPPPYEEALKHKVILSSYNPHNPSRPSSEHSQSHAQL